MASPLLPPGVKAPRAWATRHPSHCPPGAGGQRPSRCDVRPAAGARDWSGRAAVGGALREGAGRSAVSEVRVARPVPCGRAEVSERPSGHGGVTVAPLRHRELPGKVAVRVGEAGSSPFPPPQLRLVPVADASGRAGSQRAPRRLWGSICSPASESRLCRARLVCSHVSPGLGGKHCSALNWHLLLEETVGSDWGFSTGLSKAFKHPRL